MKQANKIIGRGRRWARSVVTQGVLIVVLATSVPFVGGAEELFVEHRSFVGDSSGGSVAPSQSQSIQLTEVCFTVHNSPGAQETEEETEEVHEVVHEVVHGTLFRGLGADPASTSILLSHAIASDRRAWDGGKPGVDGLPSIARLLAESGYSVFAVDRLGYGESVYSNGSGWAITIESAVRMIGELVTHIRSGTYRISNGSCDDAVLAESGAEKLVLMGFSSGAGLSELYATRDDADIDALVSMYWSNQGISNKFQDGFNKIVVPQVLQGKDYVYFFEPGDDGVKDCEELLFYRPGLSADSLAQVCGSGYYGDTEERTSPSGEMMSGATLQDQVKAGIKNIDKIPALKVFADQDLVFNNANTSSGDERDLTTDEIKMWKTECICDVSVLTQKNAGHAGWFHDSARDVVSGVDGGVIGWLNKYGL